MGASRRRRGGRRGPPRLGPRYPGLRRRESRSEVPDPAASSAPSPPGGDERDTGGRPEPQRRPAGRATGCTGRSAGGGAPSQRVRATPLGTAPGGVAGVAGDDGEDEDEGEGEGEGEGVVAGAGAGAISCWFSSRPKYPYW